MNFREELQQLKGYNAKNVVLDIEARLLQSHYAAIKNHILINARTGIFSENGYGWTTAIYDDGPYDLSNPQISQYVRSDYEGRYVLTYPALTTLCVNKKMFNNYEISVNLTSLGQKVTASLTKLAQKDGIELRFSPSAGASFVNRVRQEHERFNISEFGQVIQAKVNIKNATFSSTVLMSYKVL